MRIVVSEGWLSQPTVDQSSWWWGAYWHKLFVTIRTKNTQQTRHTRWCPPWAFSRCDWPLDYYVNPISEVNEDNMMMDKEKWLLVSLVGQGQSNLTLAPSGMQGQGPPGTTLAWCLASLVWDPTVPWTRWSRWILKRMNVDFSHKQLTIEYWKAKAYPEAWTLQKLKEPNCDQTPIMWKMAKNSSSLKWLSTVEES